MLSKIAVFLIKFYKKYIRIAFISSCRYTPSCSEYSKQAIEKYGFAKGVWKGAMRVVRCNPWSHASGYDPLR